MPKILCFLGRKKDEKYVLREAKFGIIPKWLINMFQEAIASGKKLFVYLIVLLRNSRKVMGTLHQAGADDE